MASIIRLPQYLRKQIVMLSSPIITVVMPAYNAAAYLKEAIASILQQTFRDFELIIVNDGSTDETPFILDDYARCDSRIKTLHQKNQGMIAALNRGCRLARGKYIARMDADDISLPSRLETQLEYLERHPTIGILGTWICTIQDGRVAGTWCPPTNSQTLKWTHFFGVCVPHPSVIMRRAVLQELEFYRNDAVHAEDVDLWLRASRITEFGNVPEILYGYRVWNGSTSRIEGQTRKNKHVELLVPFIREFLKAEPELSAVAGLRRTRVGPPFDDLQEIRSTAALIQKLYRTFISENALTPGERREIGLDAAKRVAALALQAAGLSRVAAISLAARAVMLDYRLLYPSFLRKGLARALPGMQPSPARSS